IDAAGWPVPRMEARKSRSNWQFGGSAEGGRTAAALYSVPGTCKHLGIDPFASLRQVLPALFGFEGSPGAEALAEGLPDIWQKRRQAVAAAGSPRAPAPSAEPALTQCLASGPSRRWVRVATARAVGYNRW